MKSTGIIRRIDELGRIVIPKELRKNLKIKDGESLEIFTDKDNIILKKYSIMSNEEKVIDNLSQILYNMTGNNIIISDREEILFNKGNILKKDESKLIGGMMDEVIENRKKYQNNDKLSVEITKNNFVECYSICYPIIVNSDIIGTISMISNEKNINDISKMYLEIVSKILSEYMEQ